MVLGAVQGLGCHKWVHRSGGKPHSNSPLQPSHDALCFERWLGVPESWCLGCTAVLAAQAMCMCPSRIWAVDSPVAPLQDDILMFGGGGGRESRPQYVQNEWSLATEFIKDYAGSVQLLPATHICRCMGAMPTLLLQQHYRPPTSHQHADVTCDWMHAGRLQAHRSDSGVRRWQPDSHPR